MPVTNANCHSKKLMPWPHQVSRGGAVVLALGIALCVPAIAQAQYYGRWGGEYAPYGYYRDGPYGGGPGPYGYEDVGPEPGYRGPVNDRSANERPHPSSPNSHAPSSKDEADVVPLDVLLRRIKAAGFKLIATPRHKGNIYLAEVEDAKSIRHRLVYDAHDGHLLENTALGPVKKLSLPAEESKVPKTLEPSHASDTNSKLNDPANQAKSEMPDTPGETQKEPEPSKAALPPQDTSSSPTPAAPADVR